MKFIKLLFGSQLFAFFFLLSTTTHLVSCEKTIYDTVIVRDTIIKTDTVCDIKKGLVAYYTFDDSSLLDKSGYDNNITYNSATPTEDRFGHANGAYLFNGSSSFMKVANSASLNPQSITLMAVVKINGYYQGACHANQIFGKGYPDPVNGYYNLRFLDTYSDCYAPVNQNGQFFVGSYGDDIPQGSAASAGLDTSVVNAGEWYTVVFTYDGEKSRIYVNGDLKDVKEKFVTFTPNEFDLFIGRHEDPSFPYWFNGVIDELRIYNRALCACEISQLSDDNSNSAEEN